MEYSEFIATFQPTKAAGDLLQSVEQKRTVRFAQPGSDDERMLDFIGAAGSFAVDLDGMSILLRLEPAMITVIEEFLHGTQYQLGLFEAMNREECEVHVKSFMLRHPVRLRLSRNDRAALEYLQEQEFARLERASR